MDIVAEIEKILKILQEEKFNPQYDFTEIKGDPGQVSAVADIVFSARIDKTMKEIQKILPDAAEFFTYSGKIEDGKLDYVDGYYVLLDLFEDLLQQAKSRGESVGKKTGILEAKSGHSFLYQMKMEETLLNEKRGKFMGKRTGILESFSEWQKLEERHHYSDSIVQGVPDKGTIEHRMLWAYDVLREELKYQKAHGKLNKPDDLLIRLTSRLKSCIAAFLHVPENREKMHQYYNDMNEAETHEVEIRGDKKVRAVKPDIVAWALQDPTSGGISAEYRKAKDWKTTFEKLWPEVVKIYHEQQKREGEEAIVKNFLDKIAGSRSPSLTLEEQEEFWKIAYRDRPMKDLNIFLTGRPYFHWRSMSYSNEKPNRKGGGRLFVTMPESCFLGGLDHTQNFVKNKMPKLWKKYTFESEIFYTSVGEAFKDFSEILDDKNVPWEEEKKGKFKIYHAKRLVFDKGGLVDFLAAKVPSIYRVVENAISVVRRKWQIEEVSDKITPDIREKDLFLEIDLKEIPILKKKYEDVDKDFEKFVSANKGAFVSKKTGIL
jgi:hypothetical protein